VRLSVILRRRSTSMPLSYKTTFHGGTYNLRGGAQVISPDLPPLRNSGCSTFFGVDGSPGASPTKIKTWGTVLNAIRGWDIPPPLTTAYNIKCMEIGRTLPLPLISRVDKVSLPQLVRENWPFTMLGGITPQKGQFSRQLTTSISELSNLRKVCHLLQSS